MRPGGPILWIAVLLVLAVVALAVGRTTGDETGGGADERVAKNVIFLLGDGLGASQRDLIRLATKGRSRDLVMNRLPWVGLVETDPGDPEAAVTDSAAAGTAFASGVRTTNGTVGLDAHGRPVPTLLERAREAGKATGLVTTAQVTDASPAAFGAHVEDRRKQSEIALQYLERSRPDVILGGGEDHWYPAGEPGAFEDRPDKDPTEESAGAHGNLVERAEGLGYDYVTDAGQLRRSRARRLLGLFANEEMFEHRAEGDGDRYEPSVPLREMTAKALDVLSRDRDGFFLFVEEEAIDEMAHVNNARLTIASGRAFDEAVGEALRFAAQDSGTLVVVTGDHATGGLAIESDGAGNGPSGQDGPFPIPGTDVEFFVDWTTDGHTGESTPLTAEGPGARTLARVQKNTDLHDAVLAAMRLP